MSKTVKCIFTLSVILNVLLVGAGAGLAYKHMKGPRWAMAKEDMSPQSREMMSEHFGKMHEEMQPLIADMKKSRDRLKAVMTADTFDNSEFDAAMAQMRQLRQQMGERMSAATRSVAAEMPAEDRRKMASHFSQGFSKGFFHGRPCKSEGKFDFFFGPPMPQQPVPEKAAD